MQPGPRKEAEAISDGTFIPSALPGLIGPGAIAVSIGLWAGTDEWTDYSAIVGGIFLVVLTAFLTLRASDKILKFFGNTGMNALSKTMGFLLLCVGIQFLIDGIVTLIQTEGLL